MSAAGPEICYSVAFLDGPDAAFRVPHARQSAAAALLLAELEGPDSAITARSKSHSRTAMAVAAANVPGISVGIDIEWMDATRPLQAIASAFLPSLQTPMTVRDFYRAWTFGEAYYKAFQHQPPEALTLDLYGRQQPGGATIQLAGGICVFEQTIQEIFQLSIVWMSDVALSRNPTFAQPARRFDI